jgi:O-antigen ligase
MAAAWRAQLYVATGLFGIAIYLIHRQGSSTAVTRYLLVVGIVHAILVLAVVGWFMPQQPGADWDGNIPFHSNIRHFAYHGYIAAAGGVAVFMVATKAAATLSVVLTSTALFGIIALGARGALGAWIVCAATAIILAGDRRRVWVPCVVSLLTAGALAYFAQLADLMPGTSNLFSRAEVGVASVYDSAGRWPIWQGTWAAILERPLLGYGPEGYYFSHCCNPRTVQPHNAVLQFLMEFGVIGCVLFLGLSAHLLRTFSWGGWRQKNGLRPSAPVAGIFAVLGGLFTYALIDGLLYHAIPLMHVAMLVGLLFAVLAWHSNGLGSGQAAGS